LRCHQPIKIELVDLGKSLFILFAWASWIGAEGAPGSMRVDNRIARPEHWYKVVPKRAYVKHGHFPFLIEGMPPAYNDVRRLVKTFNGRGLASGPVLVTWGFYLFLLSYNLP
jgi:hypothetical protein